MAPVTAVRGNNTGARGRGRARDGDTAVGPVRLYVLHDLQTLDGDLRAAGIGVVIAGHSHKPSLVERDGVLFLNPGSIGPRRFTLPVAMGFLRVQGAAVRGGSCTWKGDAQRRGTPGAGADG